MSLFLKQSKYKNGKVFLSIVDGYRVDKQVKQKVVKKLGYLSDLEKIYDDPIKHFKNEINEMKKENAFNIPLILSKNEELTENNSIFNVGYVFLKKIYEELNLPNFFKNKQKNNDINYSLNEIFSLLVFSRILYPNSKKETYQNKNIFFEPFNNFTLEDIYRSLSIFAEYKEDIEKLLWNQTKDIYKRNISKTYYNCTNYYFDIDYNDQDILDEEGTIIEKNHKKAEKRQLNKPKPVIELGLLVDSTGIPISYEIFSHNDSDNISISSFNLKPNTIIIANRDFNTSENISYLNMNNLDNNVNPINGYIFGQSVRNSNQEFKNWVLKEDDYIKDPTYDEDGNINSFRKAIFNDKNEIIDFEKKPVYFKHKSRIFTKVLETSDIDKKTGKITKKKAIINQKQMVYYSEKYADKQRRERNKLIAKAKDLINNPHKYNKSTSYGIANYIKNLKFDSNTGNIIKNLDLVLNKKKIQEEEQFDGYHAIVTSELNMSNYEIRKKYLGLINVENIFKKTMENTDTKSYVWTKDHIEAHFLICFVSSVIVRLLEIKTKKIYPTNSLIQEIRNFNCILEFSNIFLFFKTSEIIKKLENVFEIDFSKKRLTKNEIKKILNY